MKARIKKTIICAPINEYTIDTQKPSYYIPQAGDVAIFEVVSIGKHKTIQMEDKRIGTILPGDRIMAAFGTRYATAQFEGYLPEDCRQEFHILGAGGTIGVIKSMHASLNHAGPTTLRIVGYAVDVFGQVINTKYYSQRAVFNNGVLTRRARVILSVGSSMDSGKTTTAAFLSRGLKKTGGKVAFMKLTGTVFTKDKDFVYDCGADLAVDFSDAGFPSTYLCSETELFGLFSTLLHILTPDNPEYLVIEIADGLGQRETSMLLQSHKFMSMIDEVIFSSADSLSAVHGVQLLRSWGIKPVALSGSFTMSPLLIEEVQATCDIPVFTIGQLAEGELNEAFLKPMAQGA